MRFPWRAQVSPDVLQTLERADALRAQAPQVDLISLGTYFRKDAPLQSEFRSWQSTTAYAAVNTFVSARSNMGMVVDHAFWSKLHACADTFCTWDDYNWDWTIQVWCASPDASCVCCRSGRRDVSCI